MPNCCKCLGELQRKDFTKSQLRKDPAKRCCRKCQGGDLAAPPKLRFEVGQRVECKGEGDSWASGTIMRHYYRSDCPEKTVAPKDDDRCIGEGDSSASGRIKRGHFRVYYPTETVAPYQIRVDDGQLIFAPFDDDRCIRACDLPSPPCWICFDDKQSKDNFIVRDCGCRGAGNGHVHLECLTTLAVTKSKSSHDKKFNPFQQCMTCRQIFETQSPSLVALAEACHSEYADEASNPYWNEFGIRNLARVRIYQGDYLGAGELIEERVSFLRMKIIFSEDGSNDHVRRELDLIKNLQYMSEVHEDMNALEEMKAALDEAQQLIDRNRRHMSREHYLEDKARCLLGLSAHAQLEGKHTTALGYAENALQAARNVGNESNISVALFCSGKLHIKCGNADKGLKYMEESISIDERLYGRNNTAVVRMQFQMLLDGN